MADIKKRGAFFAFAIVAMLLGLASRGFGSYLPDFVAENAGDSLWAAFVYCGMSFCVPHTKIITRGAMTLGFAYAIEFSQLYHAPWIDSVRETTLGGLVLGFQFVWVDLIRYAVGVTFCVAVEVVMTQVGACRGAEQVGSDPRDDVGGA